RIVCFAVCRLNRKRFRSCLAAELARARQQVRVRLTGSRRISCVHAFSLAPLGCLSATSAACLLFLCGAPLIFFVLSKEFVAPSQKLLPHEVAEMVGVVVLVVLAARTSNQPERHHVADWGAVDVVLKRLLIFSQTVSDDR